MGKLINRIPGSCLLISSLPGWALRTHVESLDKPAARCLINLVFLRACALTQVMMTLYFLNGVANGAESTQK